MITLCHLRTSTRAAGLAEYAVLTGLLGAVALGSVFTLGGSVVQGSEAGTTALTDAFYTAEASAPAPVVPTVPGPVAGGSVAGDGASGSTSLPSAPAPRPVGCFAPGVEHMWMWSVGGDYTPPTAAAQPLDRIWMLNGAGTLHPVDDCAQNFPVSSYVSFGTMNQIFGAGPFNSHAPAPYEFNSAYRLGGAGAGFDVDFQVPVYGVEFYTHDLDGLVSQSAVRDSRGRVIRPAVVGWRDVITVEGVGLGDVPVVPSVSAPGVAMGGASFGGFTNRDCGLWDTNCNVRFTFDQPITALRVTLASGGTVDVSDLRGWITSE